MKQSLFTLILFMFSSTILFSQSDEESRKEIFKQAYECDHSGDIDCAIRKYTILAESGHVNSMVNLYGIYKGQKDHANALKWLICASDSGDAEAQITLAVNYLDGQDNTPIDTIKALGLLEPLAEQVNNVYIYLTLGEIRSKTINYKDIAKGVENYAKAAHLGDTYAALRAGKLFCDNMEVRDYAKAITYLGLAAEKNDPDAQYYLGYIYGSGKGVSIDYKEAYSWFTKAAAQGQSTAKMMVSFYKEQGLVE